LLLNNVLDGQALFGDGFAYRASDLRSDDQPKVKAHEREIEKCKVITANNARGHVVASLIIEDVVKTAID
jgi:hypothetical protein